MRRRPVTALHLKRMEIATVGNLPIDGEKLAAAFPAMPSGTSAAVSDISIANNLRVRAVAALGVPATAGNGKREATIASLDEILSG